MTDKIRKSTKTSTGGKTGNIHNHQMETAPSTPYGHVNMMTETTPDGEKPLKDNKNRKEIPVQPEEPEEKKECIEVVEFRLAGEQYGIECLYVQEVSTVNQVTQIPGTPDFILGIISIRGEILSVLDLVKFLEMPQQGLKKLVRVIKLRHHDMEFGILAEEVMGTVSIPIQEIQSPLPTLNGSRVKYLKGVTKKRLIILDAPALLTEKEMVVYQEV